MDNRHQQNIATTSRLILRPLAPNDCRRLYEYRNQPDVALFQGWTPETPEEVSNYATEMQSRDFAAAGHWYQVVVSLNESSLNEDRNIIGDMAFCIDTETNQQAELGIALDQQYHGKGYAKEASEALINFLFSEFNLHRIHISVDPQNIASQKLWEKLGFRYEAHLK
ncbi:MAG: GNAT family N-acetyltransferase, partial [Kangiellaceae bacterium]|nr:GNAT family N-acetyltransferase [Kangiellaceae bacterium]